MIMIERTDYPRYLTRSRPRCPVPEERPSYPMRPFRVRGMQPRFLRLQRFWPVLILTTVRPLRTLHADPTSSMRRYAHSAAPSSVDKLSRKVLTPQSERAAGSLNTSASSPFVPWPAALAQAQAQAQAQAIYVGHLQLARSG